MPAGRSKTSVADRRRYDCSATPTRGMIGRGPSRATSSVGRHVPVRLHVDHHQRRLLVGRGEDRLDVRQALVDRPIEAELRELQRDGDVQRRVRRDRRQGGQVRVARIGRLRGRLHVLAEVIEHGGRPHPVEVARDTAIAWSSVSPATNRDATARPGRVSVASRRNHG